MENIQQFFTHEAALRIIVQVINTGSFALVTDLSMLKTFNDQIVFVALFTPPSLTREGAWREASNKVSTAFYL